MAVQQLPDQQFLFIPLIDGRPMTPEELDKVSPEMREEIESHQDELFQTASRVLKQQHDIQRQLSKDVRDIVRKFAEQLVEPILGELKKEYDNSKLSD